MNRLLLVSFLLLLCGSAQAACVAAGPTAAGGGTGADWNNRMALPAAPTRGNTYYIMDGSYGDYQITTANSGTTRITIKKAQYYDYGRASDGCSNDISAGWNVATMGSSQANFTGIESPGVANGYITFDGNGRSGAIGCGLAPTAGMPAKDCGIKAALVQNTQGGDVVVIRVGNATANTDWIFTDIEVVGCNCSLGAGNNETLLKCLNGTCNNLVIDHNYWHDAGCDYIKPSGGTGITIKNSYFLRNDDAICHSQWFISDGAPSADVFNNVIHDIGGTAIFSCLNGCSWGTFRIYNNVIKWSSSSPGPGTQNGLIAVINASSKCTSCSFIGNTIINERTQFNGAGGLDDENGLSAHTWQNNLFWTCTSDQGGSPLGFTFGASTFTEDHNSFLNCGTSGRSGTGDVTVTSGAANPFANWTGSTPPPDFRLTGNTANTNNGTTLASPYNVDMWGRTRGADGTWDRGAFEFITSPAAPTNPRLQ